MRIGESRSFGLVACVDADDLHIGAIDPVDIRDKVGADETCADGVLPHGALPLSKEEPSN